MWPAPFFVKRCEDPIKDNLRAAAGSGPGDSTTGIIVVDRPSVTPTVAKHIDRPTAMVLSARPRSKHLNRNAWSSPSPTLWEFL
jgi:hypothetical protein